MAALIIARGVVGYFKAKPLFERSFKLLTGCWTSENCGHLWTTPDCTTPTGLIAHYDNLVNSKILLEDSLQKAALWQLEKLSGEMARYTNLPLYLSEKMKRKDKMSKSEHRAKNKESVKDVALREDTQEDEGYTEKDSLKPPPPLGCYVHGGVGTGKTMLMDMFYSHVENRRKKRLHFNAFMLDIHRRIHLLKQSLPKGSSGKLTMHDPIFPVAMEIGEETCLLCLDEFQEYCCVIRLDPGLDYRKREMEAARKLYYTCSELDAEVAVNTLFRQLASRQNDVTRPRALKVQGRELTLHRTCGRVADCTFQELCERPLGASDYLEIAHRFDTVIIRNVPRLKVALKDQARRLITLIDIFYDQKVRVAVLAEAPLYRLFDGGSMSGEEERDRLMLDELGLTNEAAKRLTLFTSEEEIFALQRTLSRLTEMQSKHYWIQAEHRHK
ncbi:lactation elevated protein 1 homolog B isoform X3 [Tachysurus fulvidraco]|uniref:lactation elevated protein 1 homolog B isoform X3 n=1 Tax=Tachysurus fulvidraco TaxID=1234273 RepID=UPI001FEF9DE0|nr:lactation elevated protein 1 homolog B isoform X3 [Tachysurus fulvidraco]